MLRVARQVHFHCTSMRCECPQGMIWIVKLLMVLLLKKKLSLASEVNILSVLLF